MQWRLNANMTGWAYNLVWYLVSPFIWVQMARRVAAGKEDKNRLQERYGKGYLHSRPKGKLIWLHAVSVGESVAALALARALHEKTPSLHFLITTNTKTAADKIQTADLNLNIIHAYQPLDHPLWVGRFLQKWQPDAAVFLESDFWPNLISLTAHAGIAVYFASAQLSTRAARRWQRRPKLASQIFSSAHRIFTVDAAQKEQFQTLSAAPDRISVEGSLKFDPTQLKSDTAFVSALDKWRQASGKTLLLLASSHAGEEQRVIDALNNMKTQERPLLIIAPRHPHRAKSIAALLDAPKRRSEAKLPEPSDMVYIADTLGEMGSLFQAADIVLLGGSFVPLGGHNPLEPASFAKPILSGPSRFKNQAAFDILIEQKALKILSDSDELPATLTMLEDRDLRQKMGTAGAEIAAHASTAPQRVASLILAHMRQRGAL